MKCIPVEKDWGDINRCQELKYAYMHFHGKSMDESYVRFRANVIEAVSELRAMPEIPFRYYMLSFNQFIEEKEYDELDAADTAHCYLRAIELKLENEPNVIEPIMNQLYETLMHVADNQAAFDAPINIYGSFEKRVEKIKLIWKAI
ncbi:hypothetical protein [Pleionea sp. CnH1-48]|uniref:hypothetical protein n=1 Tax=Pleionea sp. CnH1-48 TaxID=2954494 RepID=UPI002097E4FE|nr:hypothetical protein [Pleionea sp. CnH1-48]MCO7225746.1 hypothetical protein [Pleionea sp. CnH1-48]